MKMTAKKPLRDRQSVHLAALAGGGLLIYLMALLFQGKNLISHFQALGTSLDQIYGTGGRYLWLLRGLGATLGITCMAVVLGVAIGLLLTGIRYFYQSGAPIAFLNTLAELYITVIRGTPITVQLLIIYFGIFAAVDVNPILAASLAFGINSGAYVAEIFRAGIDSVDSGQLEAGLALGLGYSKTMRKIILPQAVKNILPTLFNEFIALVKETAIAGYVGVTDLTRAANDIRSKTWSQSPLYATALIYLILVLGLTALLRQMERRMKRSDSRQTTR